MTTQRVNCYIAGSGQAVFYVQQYNPEVKSWFDIGGTYNKIEHANAQVEHHNTQLVLEELLRLKESK